MNIFIMYIFKTKYIRRTLVTFWTVP